MKYIDYNFKSYKIYTLLIIFSIFIIITVHSSNVSAFEPLEIENKYKTNNPGDDCKKNKIKPDRYNQQN